MTFEARKLFFSFFFNLLKPVVSATYSQLIIITTAVGNFPSKLRPNPPLVKYYGGGLRPGGWGNCSPIGSPQRQGKLAILHPNIQVRLLWSHCDLCRHFEQFIC